MCEVKSHEDIAWLQYSEQHGSVGLCSRVRLYVGIFSSEKLLDTFNGEILHFVDNLASAIVAFARIAFGIFIGQARPHGLHNFVTYEIL